MEQALTEKNTMTCDAYCENNATWHLVYGCLQGHVFDKEYCSTHGWATIKLIKEKQLTCPFRPRHWIDSYLTCPTENNPVTATERVSWKTKWVTWDET